MPERIEVICGPMYCGKTEEAIRRAIRAEIAHQPVQAFANAINTRDGIDELASRSGARFRATTIKNSVEIPSLVRPETKLIVIDEANFFDEELYEVAKWLAYERQVRAIYAGLDKDFRGETFGPMGRLLSIATKVDKLTSVCMVEGCEDENARHTQRLVNGRPASYHDPVVVVEGKPEENKKETYEARCDRHWEVPDRPNYGIIYEAKTI